MAKDQLKILFKEWDEFLQLGDTHRSRTQFSTGLLALDQAIGKSDLQSGIIQIIGDEAVGKTTLAFSILATSQKKVKEITLPNGRVINAVFLDFERTFDSTYACACGVDITKVLIVKTPYAEQTFDIAEQLLLAGIQLMVIDSIAMIIPQSEEDRPFEESSKIAAEASVISRFLKRVNQLADDADALIILINQWRANISPMARTDKKPYGARIIRHVIRLTIELSRIKREDTRMFIEAFISKNKMGALGRKIQYQIKHGFGIDIAQHILSLAIDYDIVQRSGAWYNYGLLKAQGEEKAIQSFPIAEIESKVLAALNNENNDS